MTSSAVAVLILAFAALAIMTPLARAQEQADAPVLAVGQAAPDFTVPDQNGKDVTLSSLRGKWVVLYFYPRADTPGCTAQACEISEGIESFTGLNAVVIGASPDSVEAQKKFADKYNLKITLLADKDRKVLSAYGAQEVTEKDGMKSARVIRSTVLINPQGQIAHHWPKVSPRGHADMVRTRIEQLQKAAE